MRTAVVKRSAGSVSPPRAAPATRRRRRRGRGRPRIGPEGHGDAEGLDRKAAERRADGAAEAIAGVVGGDGVVEVGPRHEHRRDELPDGSRERAPDAEREGREEQLHRRRDRATRRGRRRRRRAPPPPARHEQAAGVDDVGERARRHREQEHRQHGRDLHGRDHHRVGVEARHEPAHRRVEHRDADVGDGGRDEDDCEGAVGEEAAERAGAGDGGGAGGGGRGSALVSRVNRRSRPLCSRPAAPEGLRPSPDWQERRAISSPGRFQAGRRLAGRFDPGRFHAGERRARPTGQRAGREGMRAADANVRSRDAERAQAELARRVRAPALRQSSGSRAPSRSSGSRSTTRPRAG